MTVRVDLTGKKFGRLTVRGYAGQNRWRQSMWSCVCSCDPTKTLTLAGYCLLAGTTKSCGCLMREMAAARTGSLNPAYKRRGKTKVCLKCKKRYPATRKYFHCDNLAGILKSRCKKCENPRNRKAQAIRNRKFPELGVWSGLMQRCYNPKNEHYGYYGGAGVTVCDRWRGKDGFKNFRADVGRRPVNTSIGRFDDMGNYEPGNCKWMTVKEQKLEQRKKNKRWRHNILGYAGVSKRKNGFRVHLRGPNNTSINLPGTFPTAEAAAIARDVASMRLRGDMYGLNFAPHRTVTQLNDEDRIFVLNMMDKLFKGETTC